MLAIDIPSCYVLAGVGSLIGWALIANIQTDQYRVAYALRLYRRAFLCLSGLALVMFTPMSWLPVVAKGAIGLAGMGLALLAWAFRQLNGRRTPPWLGRLVTVVIGLVLWAASWAPDDTYVRTLGLLFCALSLAMLVDQGWLILRSARVSPSELSLLAVAGVFAAHWVVVVGHVFTVTGPYPPDWLHSPSWLRPWSGLALALLPLSVASVVFAIINERLNQQLRARALSDDLTGALSRRGLRELGERMVALQAHRPSMLAVLMLDIDHFKAVNDEFGHQVGDEVLKHVTNVIRERLRPDALLSRYGGEEFIILLPVQSRPEASAAAERLRALVENTPCVCRAGKVRVTVSIGVSLHEPHRSLEQDISQADAHLYEAKHQGRNRVVSQA